MNGGKVEMNSVGLNKNGRIYAVRMKKEGRKKLLDGDNSD